MDINQKRAFVQQEFARRAAGQMPSSAGLGAPATNSLAPENPIPTEMQTATPPAPSGGAAGTPSDGAVSAMKNQKGEAQKLTEAMIARSKALTKMGQ